MLHVEEAAIKDGMRNFVFASTDTAMRLTSVMGDIKQMAEVVVQS